MKRPRQWHCRHCGCSDQHSCRIVTQRGQRDCEWETPGLCDNPQCLESEANRLERNPLNIAEMARLRERADTIRRTGG